MFGLQKKNKELIKIVERTKQETFDDFEGVMKDVIVEPTEYNGQKKVQYHLTMEATNREIGGKTGLVHEWISITAKTTDDGVVEGCVLDKYLQQLEIIHDEAKGLKTHMEVMQLMKGKKYLFKKMKHGKAFEGNDARDYFTPVKLLK